MAAIAVARRPHLRLGDGAGAPLRLTLPLADLSAEPGAAGPGARWEFGDGGAPLAATVNGDRWSIDYSYERAGIFEAALVWPASGGADRRVAVARLAIPGPSTVLAIAGTADLDEGGEIDVLGIVDQERAGRMAVDLRFDADSVRLTVDELEWLVRTNKGWAHARGFGRLGRSTARWPLRLDLRATPADPEGDRFALRLYPLGANPNFDSPARKLAGSFREPSIRLFARD